MVNVSHFLDQLSDLLARESAQCEHLSQTILQERDAIKRMALQEFVSINQARVSILECLNGLKDESDSLVRNLAAVYDVPVTARTVTDILRRTESPQGAAIIQQYERLAARTRTVQQEIAINQVLVKNIQSFLVRAMEAHRQHPQENDLYSMSGGRTTSRIPATLFRQKG
ncbi:MAG: flagellar export chaperone FlgN [Nitrospira sp.]